jgi:hypothetical protein
MVEYLCLAGVVDPALAGVFHQPGITGWVHSYYGSGDGRGRVHLLCLEEGYVGDDALDHWTQASRALDPVLAQHTITYDALVAWVGARGTTVPNWLALGLGFEGVLAQYGTLSGRVGADSVGDVTPPRQAFVPGGASRGGTFPPNASSLRSALTAKDLRRFLEERKQAAYARLEERDAQDPERKAARSGEIAVFLNFRDAQGSETDGYLHVGPYVGQDVRFLAEKNVGYDLALVQRAIFALVAAELAAEDKGAALARLLADLPQAGDASFEDRFVQATGVSLSALERDLFEGLKKR